MKIFYPSLPENEKTFVHEVIQTAEDRVQQLHFTMRRWKISQRFDEQWNGTALRYTNITAHDGKKREWFVEIMELFHITERNIWQQITTGFKSRPVFWLKSS